MPIYKDELYENLLQAGTKAGFRVTGEKYFRDRTDEAPYPPVDRTWPCGVKKRGYPDCVWCRQDGTPVAVFEIEGYDVEDRYLGGIMKDRLCLAASEFDRAVKAIILFGLKEDRISLKNGIGYTGPVSNVQAWVRRRASSLCDLYSVPENILVVLDDDVGGPGAGLLLDDWVERALALASGSHGRSNAG